MPYYSGLKDALATSSPYHFTFYPRAMADNILLVDFSVGCPVIIYKFLIAWDMLGTVRLIKTFSCRACDVEMFHFITVSRRGGLCHAVGNLRWDVCITVPVTRRFYSLHFNKVSFVELPPWIKRNFELWLFNFISREL